MECKYIKSDIGEDSPFWINRYIMECKSLIKQQHFSNALELIDTLWNVNVVIQIGTGSVLYRINRYIMECKFLCQMASGRIFIELIDTLWNVNLH